MVHGFSRSCIYDLERNNYELIPSNLAKALEENNGKKLRTLLDKNPKEDRFYWISFLLEKEFILLFDSQDLTKFFTPMGMDNWDNPYDFTSIVVQTTNGQLPSFNSAFSHVLIRSLKIVSLSDVNLTSLEQLLEQIDHSTISGVQIVTQFSDKENLQYFKNLATQNPRVDHIILHTAPYDEKSVTGDWNMGDVFCTRLPAKFEGEIKSEATFSINGQLYLESKAKNSFYYKKVFVDHLGHLRHHPNSSETFGNTSSIAPEELKNLANLDSFTTNWNTSKDQIDVCDDCEFRHMCVSSQIPRQRHDGTTYFEKECRYNPYLNKWKGQPGYADLHTCGIDVTKAAHKKNLDKINERFNETWGYHHLKDAVEV